jgi:TolB-like protein/DNA-binding winged helix-turn-helix (wHTH) protein/Tfp pilus assembly protein PilF
LLVSWFCGIIPPPQVTLWGKLTPQQFHFGDFTLDHGRYQLERGDRVIRLEKLPMELLILLVERHGELVTRDDIAGRLWGDGVFVDVEHSINTAVRKIRRALRDDPEKPRFVETVVGKGYRFSATVTCNGHSSPAQPVVPATQAISERELPHQPGFLSRRLAFALAALFLVAVVSAGWVLKRSAHSVSSAPPVIKSLAVLPLKNLSGDDSQEYLADGMTEALIGRLSGIRNLRVISHTSVMRFKNSQLSVPEIANTLHVDAIVEGSVMRDGTRIRVTAQLIRAATDEHFWSETYDREMQDILALESDVAQSIAGKVEVTLTGKEQARLSGVRPVSPEVYEDYLKGLFALEKVGNRDALQESVASFQKAIDRDPNFAPAYLGLASAYDALSTIFIGGSPEQLRPKRVAAARKALELDPELADAHVVLADIERQQWHWAEAEREYRRALEINPNDAGAYGEFAEWLICEGRIDEGLKMAQHGRELDPLAVSGGDMGWFLFLARRYDEAIHELRIAVATRPDDVFTVWYLGFALMANGNPEQAIPPLERTVSLSHRSPGGLAVLIRAYAHAGRRKQALQILAELNRRRQKGYVPAGAFVQAYLALDDRDQTFVWLEKAYQERSNILQFIKVHPFFDPLRDDPRFKDLVRRVGLE